MPFHLTAEGSITKVSTDHEQAAEATHVASRNEWEALAERWPLKRLVEIWNSLPGVAPVRKFTSRQIAVERIWRAVEHPEGGLHHQSKTSKQKPGFREGSKAAQVYRLLCRPEGATLREIQEATGWQRHTVRGFLSASVRKQGRTVRSSQRAGERVYRVKN
jgi:Protein of unknown function (DUF3489)